MSSYYLMEKALLLWQSLFQWLILLTSGIVLLDEKNLSTWPIIILYLPCMQNKTKQKKTPFDTWAPLPTSRYNEWRQSFYRFQKEMFSDIKPIYKVVHILMSGKNSLRIIHQLIISAFVSSTVEGWHNVDLLSIYVTIVF